MCCFVFFICKLCRVIELKGQLRAVRGENIYEKPRMGAEPERKKSSSKSRERK